MHFAGPICNGFTCAPFLMIVLAGILIPIGIGATIAWLFSKWIIKKVNSKRKKALDKRQSLLATISIFFFIAVVAIIVWWFPNSSILRNYVFQIGVDQVSKETIYLPENTEPVMSLVTVSKIGFTDKAYFESKSTFVLSGIDITIKEEISGSYSEKKLYEYKRDNNYMCKDLNTEISYCKALFSDFYFVNIGEKQLLVSTDSKDANAIDTVLRSLKQREIGTIKNVEFLKRSF